MALFVAPTFAHKRGEKGRHYCVYTVYDNRTDFPVIVDGEARECAKAMGIAYATFYSCISKCEKGINGRWTIIKKYIDGKPDYNRRAKDENS